MLLARSAVQQSIQRGEPHHKGISEKTFGNVSDVLVIRRRRAVLIGQSIRDFCQRARKLRDTFFSSHDPAFRLLTIYLTCYSRDDLISREHESSGELKPRNSRCSQDNYRRIMGLEVSSYIAVSCDELIGG